MTLINETKPDDQEIVKQLWLGEFHFLFDEITFDKLYGFIYFFIFPFFIHSSFFFLYLALLYLLLLPQTF